MRPVIFAGRSAKIEVAPCEHKLSAAMAEGKTILPAHPLFRAIMFSTFDGNEANALAIARGGGAAQPFLQAALEAAAKLDWAAALGKIVKAANKKLDLDAALDRAAAGDSVEALRELKGRGAREFESALSYAAENGSIASMQLLKSWGAEDYEWPLARAALGDQIPAMRLLQSWGARDFAYAMHYSAGEARELLAQWAAEAHAGRS